MKHIKYITILALCLSLVACGDDDQNKKNLVKNNTSGADMSGDMSGDMMPDMADETPETLIITPNPKRAIYTPESTIGLEVQVFNQTAQPIADAEVDWTVSPATAAVPDAMPNTWKFGQTEGIITFEACTKTPSASGSPVCNKLDVVLDAQPPLIEINSPTPGAELSLSDGANLVVSGRVTDTFGDVSAFLNDQKLELDADGFFTIELKPHFGINHISIEATDSHNLQGSKKELDVLWAPDYFETEPTTEESAVLWPDGLVLRLGQTFVDDRSPPAVTPQGAALTNDLADILTLLLRNIDLQALIPNPVLDSDSVKLNITDADLGESKISIDITPNGLELYVRAPNLVINTQGQLTLVDQTLDLTGNVTASIGLLAEIKIVKNSATDPFEVEVTRLGVAIENANSMFNDAQANAIFQLAQSALRSNIEQILIATLQTSFINAVPELLETALNSLEAAMASQTFDLDTGLGQPITVDFKGSIDALTITPLSNIAMNVEARLAAKSPPSITSRGVAITKPFALADAPFFETSRIQIGIRLGVLNGLLQSLWRSGLLNLDVSALLPDGLSNLVQKAVITGKLPPVIRAPLKGEPHDLILDVGQLELQADFGEERVTYGVSMSAGISTSIINNELVITVAQTPNIRTWIIETTTDRPKLNADQLRTVLLSQVWPLLTEALGMGLSLGLPVLDLSSIGTYAPDLQPFMLSFAQIRPLILVDDFLILDTNLRGTLPPVVAP